MVSPVNASRRPSRDAAHHSGSGWLAKPSPWGTFTSYSLPAFLAHSESGQTEKNSMRAYVFRFAPELGHCPKRSALRICAKKRLYNTFRTTGRRQHSVLDHSHNNVSLNFDSDLAVSVSACDGGRGVVGGGLQLTCDPCFDLVA